MNEYLFEKLETLLTNVNFLKKKKKLFLKAKISNDT